MPPFLIHAIADPLATLLTLFSMYLKLPTCPPDHCSHRSNANIPVWSLYTVVTCINLFSIAVMKSVDLGPTGYSSMTGSLTGRAKRSGNKEDREVWNKEVLHKLCLMPSNFLKKYSIFYSFQRGNGTELVENCHTMGRNHQEANQAELHKGTKDVSST